MPSPMQNAASPEAYLAGLEGWVQSLAASLRTEVLAAAALDERLKWGHLVYFANGPVCLVRAEPARVLFGFWRGQRLRDLDPALQAGGKYEMATHVLREGETIDAALVRQLVQAAVALNAEHGDPTDLATLPARTAQAGRRRR